MKIIIEMEKFVHLLSCMANQKYLHEMPLDMQKEWQIKIDIAWREGMDLLHQYQKPPVYAKEMFKGDGEHEFTQEKLDQVNKIMGESECK